MKTEVQMKMAKASKQDIDAAVELVGVLGDIDKGYHPATPNAEDADEPTFFDEDDPEHLRVFYDRMKECLDSALGGMFRVVWGFSMIMSNDMVDPDLDYLAFHPRIVQALARPPAGAMTYPAEIPPELHHVLGMMCFQLARNAHLLRSVGADIKTRAEDEQAYCLHWLIKHVLAHGAEWADHAEADVAAAREKIAATQELSK
ncbi:hypothetical protein [Paraburkholderia sp. RL17-347-BIC-D]|jgi:hypothetical protein